MTDVPVSGLTLPAYAQALGILVHEIAKAARTTTTAELSQGSLRTQLSQPYAPLWSSKAARLSSNL